MQFSDVAVLFDELEQELLVILLNIFELKTQTVIEVLQIPILLLLVVFEL